MTTEEEARKYSTDRDTEKILELAKAHGISAAEFFRSYEALVERGNIPADAGAMPQHIEESEWKQIIDEVRRTSNENLMSAIDDSVHQKQLTQDLEPRSGQTRAVGRAASDGDRYPGLAKQYPTGVGSGYQAEEPGAGGQKVPPGQEGGTSPMPDVDRSTGGRTGCMYFSFESEEDFNKWKSMNSNLPIQSQFWDTRTHRLVAKVSINDLDNGVINNYQGYMADVRTPIGTEPEDFPSDKYTGRKAARTATEKHFKD